MKKLQITKIHRPMMVRMYQLVMVFVLFFTGIKVANTTHIIGGNMTYRHLGGSQYEISLTLRRDCLLGSPEAEFDDPAYIGIYNEAGTIRKQIFGGQLLLDFNDDDTLNNIIMSDCGFEGTQVCVHQTTYKTVVNLPFSNDGYMFAYLRCCRNMTIENIVEPVETGATYFVKISSESMNMDNSSPTFDQWPAVYICGGEPIDFDHSATDIDGDSLVYSLCTPTTGLTKEKNQIGVNNTFFPVPLPLANVQWNNGYGLDNLLGVPDPTNYLAIDSETGFITGIPRNEEGQFLIGICVEEYRNGELIGMVKRDFQYNVRICTPPPFASFDAPNASCEGLSVEFENTSVAGTKFEWYFDWPNTDAAFFSDEENPTFDFPAPGNYDIRLRTIRNTDGCEDDTIRTIFVSDENLEPTFDLEVESCNPDGTINILLTETSSVTNPEFDMLEHNWQFIQNGDTTTYTGETVAIIPDSANFEIIYTAIATSGCENSTSTFFDISDVYPTVGYSITLLDCLSDPSGTNATIRFSHFSHVVNPFAEVSDFEWIVNGTSYTQDTFELIIDKGEEIVGSISVNFDNGCSASEEFDLNTEDLLPQTNFDITQIDCDDRNSTNILMTYNNSEDKGLDTLSVTWNIEIGVDQYNFEGDSLYLTIPKDSIMNLEMVAIFENGCIDTLLESFIPGPFASLNLIDDTEICPGNPINLVLNPYDNLTYTWDPEDGLDLSNPSDPIANPMITTQYYVTVTDGICTIEDSVLITVLEGLVIDIVGDTTTCDGSINLMATGGFGDGDYEWSNESDFSDIIHIGNELSGSNIIDSLTYYIRWTGNECEIAGDSITVTNEAIDLTTADPFEVCRLDTTTVRVFNNNPDHELTYQWEDDSHIISGHTSNEILIGLGEDEMGSFDLYIDIENQYGCTHRDTITIAIIENPEVNILMDREDCDSLKVCFDIEGEYNPFPVWDFGDPNTEDDTSFEKEVCYTYPSEGTYTVELINITANCPFVPVIKTFTMVDSFDFAPLRDTIEACMGDTLRLEVPEDYQNLSFSWCDEDGNSISSDIIFEYVVNGDDVVTLKVEDDLGCEGSFSINVIDLNDVQFNIIHTVTECGELEVCVELEGTYLGDLFWDFGDESVETDTSSLNSPCYTYSQEGTYSISVTNIGDLCNFGTVTKEITIHDEFDFEGLEDVVDCLDNTVVLSVPDEYVDYQHVWCTTDGDSITNEVDLEVVLDEDKSFVLKIVDDNGCEASKTVNLTVYQFDFDIDLPSVFCEDTEEEIMISSNENYSYHWLPEDCIISGQDTDKPVIKVEDGKTVTVEITNEDNMCSTSESFQMDVNFVEVEIGGETEIFLGSSDTLFVVDPNPDYTYEWSTGEEGTEIIITPSEDTEYCVTATDQFGCEGVDCISVEVILPRCDETDVYIPNAFSPNNDGNNDVFRVRSNFIDEMTLVVYNRWGEEIYKSSDLNAAWDGTYKNEELAPDAYAYYLTVLCTDGERYTTYGNVSLLR